MSSAFSSEDFESLREDLRQLPLVITIVGHTNVGKTSIVRTFSHDAHFGEVRDEPSVTRECNAKRIDSNGMTLARYYDTPGFERASQVARECGPDLDLDKVSTVLSSSTGDKHDHWRKAHRSVWELVRRSHLILYVVDISTAPKHEHEAELRLLKLLDVPLLVVSNFETAASSYREEWRRQLNLLFGPTLQLTPFDAHRRTPSDEKLLYLRLAASVTRTTHRQLLEFWLKIKEDGWQQAKQAAASKIAWTLLDLAAYRPEQTGVREELRSKAEQDVQKEFRRAVELREFEAMVQIAQAFHFERDVISNKPITECGIGHAHPSLWNTRNLVITSAAAGAGCGAVIDAAFGFMTFGATAAIGAIVGGATAYLSGLYCPEWSEQTHTYSLRASEGLLLVILSRLLAIAEAIRTRGHGKEKESPEEIPSDLRDYKPTKRLRMLLNEALSQLTPSRTPSTNEPPSQGATLKLHEHITEEIAEIMTTIASTRDKLHQGRRESRMYNNI